MFQLLMLWLFISTSSDGFFADSLSSSNGNSDNLGETSEENKRLTLRSREGKTL